MHMPHLTGLNLFNVHTIYRGDRGDGGTASLHPTNPAYITSHCRAHNSIMYCVQSLFYSHFCPSCWHWRAFSVWIECPDSLWYYFFFPFFIHPPLPKMSFINFFFIPWWFLLVNFLSYSFCHSVCVCRCLCFNLHSKLVFMLIAYNKQSCGINMFVTWIGIILVFIQQSRKYRAKRRASDWQRNEFKARNS